jgi:hypothetical protein
VTSQVCFRVLRGPVLCKCVAALLAHLRPNNVACVWGRGGGWMVGLRWDDDWCGWVEEDGKKLVADCW